MNLRQAGLNPNLVYGSGVDGNQSSASQVGLSNRNPQTDFGFAEMANNVFRRRQLENETRLSNANVANIMANQQLTQARYLDIMLDVVKKDANMGTELEQAKANLRHTNQTP